MSDYYDIQADAQLDNDIELAEQRKYNDFESVWEYPEE